MRFEGMVAAEAYGPGGEAGKRHVVVHVVARQGSLVGWMTKQKGVQRDV